MQAFSSHDIFQTLYQQIMLLELKPGSTLRENALCEQFGVSRTPVRSVLQELRIAGLIEVTPYKSTRVTQLDFALNPACVCGIIVIFFAFSYTLRRSFAP